MTYAIPEKYRTVSKASNGENESAVLSVEWSGTAGMRLSHGGCTLLIDPFVTRSGLFRTLLLRLPSNKTLSAKTFPVADHILLGHSHYDHLMDVPAIAAATGAVVHGSESTAAVCRGAGLPESNIHVIETGKSFDCGKFKATFIKSVHGKAIMGRIPSPGNIVGTPLQPMKGNQYKDGGTFGLLVECGGFRIYHGGSADLIDGETAAAGNVDLLLLGLAGRKHTPDYIARMTKLLKPKFIVPIHYDNFFKPLGKGLSLLPGIDVEAFFREIETVYPEAKVKMPELFERVQFDIEKRIIL